MAYNNLHVTILDDEQMKKQHDGYKYLITSGATPYVAFKTDAGYRRFLEIANVKPILISEKDKTHCEEYHLLGRIEERLFWDLAEIPLGAVKFTGLSNGGLVDCYYLHTHDGSIIYMPNPNARNVYNPLPIEKHIAFKRAFG